jgi:hypothetical protein
MVGLCSIGSLPHTFEGFGLAVFTDLGVPLLESQLVPFIVCLILLVLGVIRVEFDLVLREGRSKEMLILEAG